MYWLYHTTITWCNNIPPRYKFTELVHTKYQFTDVHRILTTSLTTLLMLIAIFYVVAFLLYYSTHFLSITFDVASEIFRNSLMHLFIELKIVMQSYIATHYVASTGELNIID